MRASVTGTERSTGPKVGEALVVGQGDELDRGVELVVSGPGSPVEAPEQPEPADLDRELAEEAHERPLAEHDPVALAVQVVGVDDQPHRGRSAQKRSGLPTVSVLIPVLEEGESTGTHGPDDARPAVGR